MELIGERCGVRQRRRASQHEQHRKQEEGVQRGGDDEHEVHAEVEDLEDGRGREREHKHADLCRGIEGKKC